MPKRKTQIIQTELIRRDNNLRDRQITKKSAKSSALIPNEEKSDESQKPILRKFYQSKEARLDQIFFPLDERPPFK
jgi:hypothetical protein